MLIGIDRDPAAVHRAKGQLRGLPVRLVQANFCDLPEVLGQLEIQRVNGVVLDLGLSSDQLADQTRGFSFSSDGPLDLRYDPMAGQPAHRLISRLSVEHLTQLISAYGEERYSPRIARAIVERRRRQPIETAAELAELVRQCVPVLPRPADRPGHTNLPGLAHRGERRAEIAGDRLAADSRIACGRGRGW